MVGSVLYPPASRVQWYSGGRFGGSKMSLEAPVCVLHTTEGGGWPAYRLGGDAPTLTYWPLGPGSGLWRQHFPVNESSRALMNLSGGVQTNTAGAMQVELVGTCDAATADRIPGIMYWPEAPDWALQDVADFLAWANREVGLPLVSTTRPWLAYGKDQRRPGVWPASYGASPARMSFAEWESFSGVCGHQHVPENDHGDPGNIDIAKILAFAKGKPVVGEPSTPEQPAPPAPLKTSQEDPMRIIKNLSGGDPESSGYSLATTRGVTKLGGTEYPVLKQYVAELEGTGDGQMLDSEIATVNTVLKRLNG